VGDARPAAERAPGPRRWQSLTAAVAVALLAAVVATGVTVGILQYQSRTNTQQVNLRSGVTISEDSAIVQVAARAKPAVVSVVTQKDPTVISGSGYLATSDGYIVTNIAVIARAKGMTVLVVGDPKPHDARLVDYDCQTGVAVIKMDQVSGLPTLAFADPTSLVQGQVLVAVAGPLEGSAVTRGIISALHRPVTVNNPASDGTQEISDTIRTDPSPHPGANGAPLLNVGGQVVAVGMIMQGPGSTTAVGFGLSAADVQDDVQQILQTGQLVVPSMGLASTDLIQQAAALSGSPEGSRIVSVEQGGPAAAAGLQPGDVITQLDDVSIDAAHPLRLLLRSRFHPNQRVAVTYTRGSNTTQVQLTLGGAHPTCA
jgi:putative serine protease PepD